MVIHKRKKRRSCGSHKRVGDINLRIRKRCNHEGCNVEASFGNPDDGIRVTCLDHKRDDHINLKSRRCDGGSDGHRCIKRAAYGDISICF